MDTKVPIEVILELERERFKRQRKIMDSKVIVSNGDEHIVIIRDCLGFTIAHTKYPLPMLTDSLKQGHSWVTRLQPEWAKEIKTFIEEHL